MFGHWDRPIVNNECTEGNPENEAEADAEAKQLQFTEDEVELLRIWAYVSRKRVAHIITPTLASCHAGTIKVRSGDNSPHGFIYGMTKKPFKDAYAEWIAIDVPYKATISVSHVFAFAVWH